MIFADFDDDLDDLLGDGSAKSKPSNKSAKNESSAQQQQSNNDRSKLMKDLFGLEGKKKTDTAEAKPTKVR